MGKIKKAKSSSTYLELKPSSSEKWRRFSLALVNIKCLDVLVMCCKSLKDDFFACSTSCSNVAFLLFPPCSSSPVQLPSLLLLFLLQVTFWTFVPLPFILSWWLVSLGNRAEGFALIMSMLKVWNEDNCLYLDYEDEDEFFLVTKTQFYIFEKKIYKILTKLVEDPCFFF